LLLLYALRLALLLHDLSSLLRSWPVVGTQHSRGIARLQARRSSRTEVCNSDTACRRLPVTTVTLLLLQQLLGHWR
jgi:hypothetical protein